MKYFQLANAICERTEKGAYNAVCAFQVFNQGSQIHDPVFRKALKMYQDSQEGKVRLLNDSQIYSLLHSAFHEGRTVYAVRIFPSLRFNLPLPELWRAYLVSNQCKWYDGTKAGSGLPGYCLNGAWDQNGVDLRNLGSADHGFIVSDDQYLPTFEEWRREHADAEITAL